MAQDSTVNVAGKSSGLSIPDTLLFKIQRAQSVITDIKASGKKGYGTTRIRTELADVKSNVAPVARDVQTHRKTIDAKTLSNYGLILNDAQKKLTDWRTQLSKANNDLQNQLEEVLALSNDSLLTVAGNDTTEKKLYADQLVSLKLQLQDAGVRTTAQLDTVSRLLADVSGTYLNISNLQISINERLQKNNASILQKESPFLWEAPVTFDLTRIKAIFSSSYQGQDKILSYFFVSTWDNRFLLLLLTGAFFIWVYRNFRRIRRPALGKQIGPVRWENLRPSPIVASLIVLLTLTPLFEPQSPSLYIEITQVLLFAVLTLHLWALFSKSDLWLWVSNGVLYCLLLLTSALIGDSLIMRIWLIALNLGLLYFGVGFSELLKRKPISNRIVRPIIKLSLLLQGLAIVLNLFGRVSLAKVFSITAAISLVQITGLGVFIGIVLEALELQIKISAYSKGLFSRVNIAHTQRSFKKGLAFVAVVLWLIVFFINLGVADSVWNFLYQILTRPRSFGSVTFTLSNVLSFAIIIYLSSLLQKNIGLLFGESQLPGEVGQVDHLSSVLVLLRLVIVIAGVLLAVAASGISVDKFTVVLGALSVGIGLGMQNIVSNFVSGIILIFERPFQIGDYVELADKKGRIRDIGIRSSKMITGQGSEVIIPNSDLLSNRLVNWTSNDSYLKTTFPLKVGLSADLAAVRQLITDEVSQLDGSVESMTPEILVTAVGADTAELSVTIWIKNVYAEASLKSELLQRLIPRFTEANIKLA
ncbi:hypothetical protein GCM10028773_48500 [Spirosoma koreense]